MVCNKLFRLEAKGLPLVLVRMLEPQKIETLEIYFRILNPKIC